MTVLAWRLGILVGFFAVWEAVAAPLNPLFYIRPSSLPGALLGMWRVPDLPPLGEHVWLTLQEIAGAYVLAVAAATLISTGVVAFIVDPLGNDHQFTFPKDLLGLLTQLNFQGVLSSIKIEPIRVYE